MKQYALGYACNLNDLFYRFPYEKCPNLPKNKQERKNLVKKVFRKSINIIIKDIIDNNQTFILPPIGYNEGEIHFEPIKGEQFKKIKMAGGFKGVDFLKSFFTGFRLFLYIHGKRDNFLARKKFPVYVSAKFRNIISENINNNKQYG